MDSMTQREQFDRLLKESQTLKQKTDLLESENLILKKSIFDLSIKYNLIAYQHHVNPTPYTGPSPTEHAVLDDPIDHHHHHLHHKSSVLNAQSTQLSPKNNGIYMCVTFLNQDPRDKHRDSKYFTLKSDLKGHTGAVYTIQFSPCGRFLASGSFDKSVRIWDAASTPKELHVMKRHTVNISEVSWSNNSKQLVSAAYDQSCVLWDTEVGKPVQSFECDGFVQCVQFNQANNHLFVHGSTRKVLGIVDVRDSSTVSIKTNAMVNSVHVYSSGMYILTGDSMGMLKLYDCRHANKCVDSIENEQAHRPISHIAVSRTTDADEPRYLACNSYDNVIRVYDRGFAPPQSQTRLLHSLKGHKNKNWPIKSAFYNCGDFTMSTFPKTQIMDESIDTSTDLVKNANEPAMLLATGSADAYAYLYAVGMSEGQTEMVQRLEGHSDRVYTTAFHPTDPVLATCSADFSIKVWSSTGKGRHLFTL